MTEQSHRFGETEKDTAISYTTYCFPEILLEMNIRGMILYYDNVSSHSSRLAVEFLEKKHQIIEYPLYSPDLVMWGFRICLI